MNKFAKWAHFEYDAILCKIMGKWLIKVEFSLQTVAQHGRNTKYLWLATISVSHFEKLKNKDVKWH